MALLAEVAIVAVAEEVVVAGSEGSIDDVVAAVSDELTSVDDAANGEMVDVVGTVLMTTVVAAAELEPDACTV